MILSKPSLHDSRPFMTRDFCIEKRDEVGCNSVQIRLKSIMPCLGGARPRLCHGVGIPAHLPCILKRENLLSRSFVGTTLNDLEPHGAENRGVSFGVPTRLFLTKLLGKLNAATNLSDELRLKAIRLNDIVTSEAQLKVGANWVSKFDLLVTNYTVVDLLHLFPAVVDADDLQSSQLTESGTQNNFLNKAKTYAVYEDGPDSFVINVARTGSTAYQNLFDEDRYVTRAGENSSTITDLQVGERIELWLPKVEGNFKLGPKVPVFSEVGFQQKPHEFIKPQRPVLLVMQGNATIRSIAIMQDLASRKAKGEPVGNVVVVLAYKTESDILEKDVISKFIKNNTIDQLHICLSRSPVSHPFTKVDSTIYTHHRQRVQDLISSNYFVFFDSASPFTIVAGGQEFVAGNQNFLKNEGGQTVFQDSDKTVVRSICETFNFNPSKEKNGDPGNIQYSQSSIYNSSLLGAVYSVEQKEGLPGFWTGGPRRGLKH